MFSIDLLSFVMHAIIFICDSIDLSGTLDLQ